MPNTKTTVLMSVYNGQKFLKEAIDSILNQTYSDFEFIIINDNSTDRTSIILKEYENNDKRIKIINNKKNIGLTKSLNKGLGLAKGKYIARLDADDISLPNRLEKQIAFLEKNNKVCLVGSWHQVIDDDGKLIGEYTPLTDSRNIKNLLHQSNQFLHSSAMFRKNCLGKDTHYREEFRLAQDYDLWLRIAEKHQIAKIPECLVQWRLNLSSCSIKRKAQQIKFANLAKALARQRKNQSKDSLQIFKEGKNKSDLKAFLVKTNSVNKMEIIQASINWLKILLIYKRYGQVLKSLPNIFLCLFDQEYC